LLLRVVLQDITQNARKKIIYSTYTAQRKLDEKLYSNIGCHKIVSNKIFEMHHCQELDKMMETNILFAMYGATYKKIYFTNYKRSIAPISQRDQHS
jgi:hypothetical protein